MKKPYQPKRTVELSGPERRELRAIVKSGRHKAREIMRAGVLLKSDTGLSDHTIAEHVGTSKRTVERIRLRFTEGRLKLAICDAPRSGKPGVVTDTVEATIVATACSLPPEGFSRWTLKLLQKKMLKDRVVKHLSTVAIWRHLQSRGIKPWLEKNVVHPDRHPAVHHSDGTSA